MAVIRRINIKGFVIAGTGSGSGKTTTTLAVMAFLAEKGYRIAPFKVGPDFIDPGYHRAVTGRISRNLDSWMLSKAYNEKIFLHGTENADIAVVEGVMGLFDGFSGTREAGSTSEMAKWLNLPVILIVDARSMARSAAAIVQGFENFDTDLNFAGVIFNRTGSLRHYEYLREAVEATCKMPCIGFLPRNDKIIFPERHLGLVTTDEHLVSSDIIAELVTMVEKNTKMEEVVKNLPDIPMDGSTVNTDTVKTDTVNTGTVSEIPANESSELLITGASEFESEKIRIAVARDKAFCFYYQENFEILEQNGAEIVFFSPVNDVNLPSDIDGIYLGGGYPELFADRLSQNKSILKQIKEKSLAGMPVYGECGGFMYLCSSLTGMNEKEKFSMIGCFPFSVSISKKMRSLGYREIMLKKDTLVGKKGDVLRGHEFHYSFLDDLCETSCTTKYKFNDVLQVESGEKKEKPNLPHDGFTKDLFPERIYSVTNRNKQKLSLDGFQVNNTLGSYLHIHFGSAERPGYMNSAGHAFVNSCISFKKGLL